jgi:GT2 family glycosyltransferase
MGLVPHPAVNRPARPVVSVCIANYNGEALLDDCIESVLAQDAGESIEIIVHDDASTDGSVELLRSRYPGVELLASTENVGFCIANNRMVAHARGEFVLLLNNDAALHPDAVSTLLATSGAQDVPGILTLPQYDWQTGWLVDRGCLLDPFYNPVPNLDPARDDVAYAIGACLWLPRATWIELGGLPEWMGSIGEDIYLCSLARLRGMTVRTTSSSGFRHHLGASFGGARIRPSGLHTTQRRRRLSERNKTLALAILTPTPAAWGLLALHLSMLLVEGALVGVANRDLGLFRNVYVNSLVEAWRLRGTIFAQRRSAQRSRSASVLRYLSAFVWLPQKLTLLSRHGIPRVD